MRINKVDKKLLYYLFQYRAATKVQIARDIYNHSNLTSTGNRLRALAKAKLITVKGHHALEGRKVYGVTKKGLLHYVYDGKIPYFASKSYCPVHDLKLLEILRRLEASSEIHQVYSENELRKHAAEKASNVFGLNRINPDALLLGKIKEIDLKMTLEFERKQKKKQMYQELIRKYYDNSEIDIVLYICEHRYILNEIKAVEDNCLLGNTSKIFYCLAKDFFASSYPKFISIDQNEIELSIDEDKYGNQYGTPLQKPLFKMLQLIGIKDKNLIERNSLKSPLIPLHGKSREHQKTSLNNTGGLNG